MMELDDRQSARPSGQRGCACRADRREFLRQLGTSGIAALGAALPTVAGPFEARDFESLIPADKKFRREWLDSLTARGEPESFSGDELRFIGMPVGGLFSGLLYLGGDGRLWLWEVFNREIEGVVSKQVEYAGAKLGSRDGALFVAPLEATSPVHQGFALRFRAAGDSDRCAAFDRSGFREVTFTGQYPIGTVTYRDPDIPVSATLSAFSPFIPLHADDSSLPATVLEFTLTNTSDLTVTATLTGWLENAVCLHHRQAHGSRRNQIVPRPWGTLVISSAQRPTREAGERAEIIVEDWNRDSYSPWTVTGEAFGSGPIRKKAIPGYQGDVGGPGQRVVNSHATAPGEDIAQKDRAIGRLVSRPFVIERDFIHLWIGGGAHRDKTCVNLLVDGQRVLSLTGRDRNQMERATFEVHDWAGRSAMLEIVDAESGGWGNIGVGTITQSDAPTQPLEELHDFGTMALALLGDPAEEAQADFDVDRSAEPPQSRGAPGAATVALERRLTSALGRSLTLAPGEQAKVTFVIAWHFPNLRLGSNLTGRSYAARFADAAEVADYVGLNFQRLAESTRLWRDTWYDSTLPYWFLNRTFANTSILATTTCYRLRNGRFWAWEGVGCCPGACTHVWHYAQAMGRIFPEIERDQRERVDFGLALDARSGVVKTRAEHSDMFSVDGQCGAILRALREHQMSADDQFLRRVWPNVARAVECLLVRDQDHSGILRGPMHNTLDADWYGVVPWLVGMYHAALRAAETMAVEMGATQFASRCRATLDRGVEALDRLAWSERHGYYIHLGDPLHESEVGSYEGCHIDQVLGESWARQVGIAPVMNAEHVRRALNSLWRYNVTPDVGPFRAANKPGRWYAMPGDGGLLMVTFPFGRPPQVTGAGAWSAMYFNECMSGFEWQVAAHMLWERMATEGLAVARLIHDRYHARLRNPYNEIECSDHYARAMASYGAFLAICGFEYHGPRGRLGFAPRVAADDFRAAFTSAEAWGTIAQRRDAGRLAASVTPKLGSLRLRTLALELPAGAVLSAVAATLDGIEVAVSGEQVERRVEATFSEVLTVNAGTTLEVQLN